MRRNSNACANTAAPTVGTPVLEPRIFLTSRAAVTTESGISRTFTRICVLAWFAPGNRTFASDVESPPHRRPRKGSGDNMDFISKAASLTLAIAGAFASMPADAAVVERGIAANAPAHCQAFTPGPANTIRNRVVGSENVGATMNVACSFEKEVAEGVGYVKSVHMYFSYSGNQIETTVKCTLLTGWQGQAGAVAINKSVTFQQGFQGTLVWSAGDTPDTGDTDLGADLVGVNCTLPTGAVINDTYLYWDEGLAP
jgi:hypothetical protein